MHIPQQTHGAAPFRVKITPRSEAHAALIRRECKAIADELTLINSGTYPKVAAV